MHRPMTCSNCILTNFFVFELACNCVNRFALHIVKSLKMSHLSDLSIYIKSCSFLCDVCSLSCITDRLLCPFDTTGGLPNLRSPCPPA